MVVNVDVLLPLIHQNHNYNNDVISQPPANIIVVRIIQIGIFFIMTRESVHGWLNLLPFMWAGNYDVPWLFKSNYHEYLMNQHFCFYWTISHKIIH